MVGEKEGDNGDDDCQASQRGHHLACGDAGGLQGDDFVTFAHVAESHQGSKHNRQRECHGREGDSRVKQQFQHYGQLQTFAHKLIHPFPDELHEQNKQCHEEGEEKGTEEVFAEVFVDDLHAGKY